MGALLALASAALYGVVGYAGGLLSRRMHFAVVTFLGQIGGLLLALGVRSCRRESESEGDGEGVALLLSRSMTEHARVSRST